MSRGLEVATVVTAGGCAVVGGVFFAFSSFVMRGLEGLPPGQGASAMQAINRSAVTPAFMIALFGTGAACAGLAAWRAAADDGPAAGWIVAGAAVYLAGAVVLTAARNVPLNDALAALDPADAGTAPRWRAYAREWTAWNHVRALSSVAAAGLLAVSVARGG